MKPGTGAVLRVDAGEGQAPSSRFPGFHKLTLEQRLAELKRRFGLSGRLDPADERPALASIDLWSRGGIRLQPAVLPSGLRTRKPSPDWLSTSGSPSESPSGVCRWLVLQTNGAWCGPEKIGPVIG